MGVSYCVDDVIYIYVLQSLFGERVNVLQRLFRYHGDGYIFMYVVMLPQ